MKNRFNPELYAGCRAAKSDPAGGNGITFYRQEGEGVIPDGRGEIQPVEGIDPPSPGASLIVMPVKGHWFVIAESLP